MHESVFKMEENLLFKSARSLPERLLKEKKAAAEEEALRLKFLRRSRINHSRRRVKVVERDEKKKPSSEIRIFFSG